MIYLMESGEYYKIGYAKDVEKRMKAYSTHNPNFKLIDSLVGTKEVENTLHKLCKDFQVKSEWFYKKDEILIIWNTYKQFSEFLKNKTSEFNKLSKLFLEQDELFKKYYRNTEKFIKLQQESLNNYETLIKDLKTILDQDIPTEELLMIIKKKLEQA